MPRIQALSQQHFLERNVAPTASRMLSGIAGTSEGVPKMHPLKSSMPKLSSPVAKAATLIHGMKLAKPKGMKMGMRMPRLSSGMRMPRLGG